MVLHGWLHTLMKCIQFLPQGFEIKFVRHKGVVQWLLEASSELGVLQPLLIVLDEDIKFRISVPAPFVPQQMLSKLW